MFHSYYGVFLIRIQFNHFLIKDDQPLLYHAGLKGMFPLLYEAVKAFYDKFYSNPITDPNTDMPLDNTYFVAAGDNGMCTVNELCAILASREYYDRGRILHNDTDTEAPDFSFLWTLLSYNNGVFRIRGKNCQTHSYNMPVPAKYLSRFFYACFLYDQREFLNKIRSDSVYRELFCQCFKLEWSP